MSEKLGMLCTQSQGERQHLEIRRPAVIGEFYHRRHSRFSCASGCVGAAADKVLISTLLVSATGNAGRTGRASATAAMLLRLRLRTDHHLLALGGLLLRLHLALLRLLLLHHSPLLVGLLLHLHLALLRRLLLLGCGALLRDLLLLCDRSLLVRLLHLHLHLALLIRLLLQLALLNCLLRSVQRCSRGALPWPTGLLRRGSLRPRLAGPHGLLRQGVLNRLPLRDGRPRGRRETLGRLARPIDLHLLDRRRRGRARLTGRAGTVGLLQRLLLAIWSGDPRLRLTRSAAGRQPLLRLSRPVGLLRQRLSVLAGKRPPDGRARARREILLRL